MITESPFVIFSAELASLSEESNRNRTALMAGALSNRGIEWQRVDGAYEGHREASFLVFTYEGSDTADQIEKLAQHYQQESILYVDAQRLAYLLMVREGRTIELGKFKELTWAEAERASNYTEIGGRVYGTAQAV
jgi:enoyl-[acyl-carrier-protein] reductase (NADH)